MVDRPKRVATGLGNAAMVGHAVAPKMMDAILNTAKQGAAERCVHADIALGSVDFVRAHDSVFALDAVVVFERHPGPEKYSR